MAALLRFDVSGEGLRALARAAVLLLPLAGLATWSGEAMAVAKYSRASAGWSTVSTWSDAACGGAASLAAPTAADDVTICTGHTITTNANSSALSLSIQTGGTLTQATNRTLAIGTGGLNVAGTLTSRNTLSVAGTTSVSGTLAITTATGTKTFTGAVTVGAGGVWNNSGNEAVTLQGGLTHNGATFTAGTGIYTFNTTAAQTLNCATALAIPSLTVTSPAVLTNNCFALTVATALAGTGNLTNSATSTLNIGGTSTITGLTANAVGNTVNYSGAAQTIKTTTYHHLALSNAGTKSLAGATTVAGNFSIGVGATFSNGANALSVAGNFDQSGIFTAGTGVVTLNGGAAVQTISGTGPLGFANLTVSNTGGITLARNVTVTSAIIGTATLTPTCPVDYTLTSNGGVTVAHSCPAPAVVSINLADANPTTAASVSWTVTFSRSVTGVSSGNFALVNTGLGGAPAITSIAGSSTVWTVTASTGTGDGTLGLDMVNDTGVSLAMTNLPFTGQVYSINRSLPAVLSITRADPTPTALASVSWNVTFSESVTGVDAADFALVWASGAGGGAIASVTGSGAAWVVTASTGTGNGTLGLNLVDDDSIVDTANNPLGGAGAGNGNFTGEVYTLDFTVPSFVFTNSPCVHNRAFGNALQTCAPVTWLPQVAGQDLVGVYITAVSAAGIPTRLHASQQRTTNMQFGLTCHDPVANAGVQAVFAGLALPLCQANGGMPAAWSATVTVTFNAGSPSSAVSYIFNYADVGMVELWMRNSAAVTQVGKSGQFVAKPGGFVLSGIQQTAAPNTPNPAAANAAGAKFVKAGEAFSVTVTATTCSPASAACTVAGAATPNYGKEVAPEGVKLTPSLAAGLGLVNNPAIGGAFGAFTNGVATGVAFTWNEAGIITLTPSVTDADYLGTGDVAGTTTGNVGRFIPDHFDTAVVATATVPMPCPNGLTCPVSFNGFVYSGQPFSVTVSARNTASCTGIEPDICTTQNYQGAFARAVTLSAWDAPGGATPNPGPGMSANNSITSTAFISGVEVTAVPTYVFNASPAAPTDIYVRADEPAGADGVSSLRGASSVEGGVKVVSGRTKIGSAHGSGLLLLPMAATVQYYDGASWLTSVTDSVTSLTVGVSNYQCKTGCPWTTTPTPASGAITAGILAFKLSKPTGGGTGSVDVSVSAPDYLLAGSNGAGTNPSNKARATFGVYKGSNEFIYLREVYY